MLLSPQLGSPGLEKDPAGGAVKMRGFCWPLLLGLVDAAMRRALVVVDMTVEQALEVLDRGRLLQWGFGS